MESLAGTPGQEGLRAERRARWALPLAAITVLGLALRLMRNDAASFWADELFSVWWVRHDLGFLWGEGMVLEPNPPLYYTLLKAWLALAGSESEAAVRAFSALCSAATIPLVALLGRAFGGWRVGLLAAALLAIAPVQLYYAQEARTYALLNLLTAAALLGVVRFAQEAEAGGIARRWLLLYGAAAIAMVYSHATAAITLAALNLVALGWLLARRRAALPALLAVDAAVLLLAVPQILTMLGYMDRSGELDFIGPPGLVQLANLANTLLVDPATPWWAFGLASLASAAVLGLLVPLLLLARPGALAWAFLAGVPALFLALALFAGVVAAPVLVPRAVSWMSAPFCVLAAFALLSRAPVALRAAFALALAGAVAIGLHGVTMRMAEVKEDWRGLSAELARSLRPGDLFAVSPTARVMMPEVYGPPGLAQLVWVPEGAAYHPFVQLGAPPPAIGSAEIAREVAAGRRAWLVLRMRDWERFGAQALEIVPGETPLVERGLAQLVVLRWPSAGQDARADREGQRHDP